MRGGGQYFCHKCKATHNDLSKIGMDHIRYASKEMQRISFMRYGIYKK